MLLRGYRILGWTLCATALFSLASSAIHAASPGKKEEGKESSQSVDFFDALEKGSIDVKLIPKDSRGGNVLITNKTKAPLAIKMPEAFAAVPVLAQFGGGGLGGGQQGGFGGGAGGIGGQQALGGGFGGQQGGGFGGGGFGGGGGGLGGGGGFFNVGPEKVGKIKVVTVCLEHGKPDPSQRVSYEVRRIESYTDKPELAQLCAMVGRGEIAQNAAQAATWHITDGLSWTELLQKVRAKHLDGSTEAYFSPTEVQFAMQIVAESVRRGKENPLPKGSKQDSLSRQ